MCIRDRVIDFAMDIVEIDSVPKAKRGKRSGVKQVYELVSHGHRTLPVKMDLPMNAIPLIQWFITDGKIVQTADMSPARERVLTWIKWNTEKPSEKRS